MKIGKTFSHHPTVHTEWFNFIHALNFIFLCFGVMNQKQGKQISNQGQNQFKTKFFLTRAQQQQIVQTTVHIYQQHSNCPSCSLNHLILSENRQQDHRVTLTLGTGAQVKKGYMSSFLSAQSLPMATSHQNQETYKSGMSQPFRWFKPALVNVLSNIVLR